MTPALQIKTPPAAIYEFSSRAEWGLPLKIVFRFVASYFILYNLPCGGHVNLFVAIPGGAPVSFAIIRATRRVVEWAAAHVFHLTGSIAVYPQVNGSGDSTLDYVHEACMLAVAFAAAALWSILDRKRANYRRFHAWLRIFIRYSLALTLFSYGFAKVVPLQFQPPSLIRLVEPLNEFSPMGVLWTFMGASLAYTIFAGAAEVIGGLLLIPRRTTTLGALVSAGVMLNVVLLNFCYDVPVKLYSSNLLLMAIFLAAPDLGRLVDALVRNRATRPSRVDNLLFRSRPWWIAATALKTILIGYVLYSQIKSGILGYKTFYLHPARSPLYGIWNVEGAARFQNWSKVVMDRPQVISVRRDEGPVVTFVTTYDEAHHRITLKDAGYLDYTRSGDALRLEGIIKGERLAMDLKRLDLDKVLLTSRGFHWINERPFNR